MIIFDYFVLNDVAFLLSSFPAAAAVVVEFRALRGKAI